MVDASLCHRLQMSKGTKNELMDELVANCAAYLPAIVSRERTIENGFKVISAHCLTVLQVP